MEKDYSKIMSQRTDKQLIQIVTVERDKYESSAIDAAELEIQRRNIDKSKFIAIKEEAKVENYETEKVNSKAVGSGIRFFNFLIDFTCVMLIVFVVNFISNICITTSNETTVLLYSNIFLFGSFIVYYSIMEMRFQKTIGKFVTKTKVVKANGEKPGSSDIIIRTLCRFVPFDRISYLFTKNGFHDYLSKTKVIWDSKE